MLHRPASKTLIKLKGVTNGKFETLKPKTFRMVKQRLLISVLMCVEDVETLKH